MGTHFVTHIIMYVIIPYNTVQPEILATLNLAVWPQTMFLTLMTDLNWQYGTISPYIHAHGKKLADFNLAV